MSSEIGESNEKLEWQGRMDWVDPGDAVVDGDELHWNKLNQEDARASFAALERMRPFLGKNDLFNDKDRYACRNRLAEIKDDDGGNLFNDQDLRFYDLYFGDARIVVSRVGDKLDVTNGRHRLAMARAENIQELPVLLNEQIAKETNMSNLELADIEKETLEQYEEVEEMETDIEQHKARVEELEEALQKIRAANAEIGSDALRKTEEGVENARVETERNLEEIRHRRDELLLDNKELAGKLIVEHQKHREIRDQHMKIKMKFQGASDEFKSQINQAGEDLNEDLKNMAEAEESVLELRNKLEKLDV